MFACLTKRPRLAILSRQPRDPALLDCQADPSCGRWVTHIYKRIEELKEIHINPKTGKEERSNGIHDIYRCACCGTERRWG